MNPGFFEWDSETPSVLGTQDLLVLHMVLIAASFRISQLNTWLFTVRVPQSFPNKWSDLEGEERDRETQPAEEITDRKASRETAEVGKAPHKPALVIEPPQPI